MAYQSRITNFIMATSLHNHLFSKFSHLIAAISKSHNCDSFYNFLRIFLFVTLDMQYDDVSFRVIFSIKYNFSLETSRKHSKISIFQILIWSESSNMNPDAKFCYQNNYEKMFVYCLIWPFFGRNYSSKMVLWVLK